MRTAGYFACAVLVFATPPGLTGNDTSTTPPATGVTWKPLLEQSVYFLGIQHTFRLATEPGTRNGARGSYWKGYARSVANLHGWSDGDPAYVNYVGHPMQGAFSGYLWTQNDPKYFHVEFGKSRDYWRSRLRATAFQWAYSSQFELGPLSEASVGQIQSRFPQQGFVDLVITPTVGLGWMMAEDAVDRYLVKWIESRTNNRWARLLARGGLNPARSGANALRGRAPWHRDNRPGIRDYDPATYRAPLVTVAPPPEVKTAAPFEAQVHGMVSRYGERSCVGGGATAAARVAHGWQVVFDTTGCAVNGLRSPVSADSITYLLGPRWRPASRRRLNPHAHLLIGGQKISMERVDLARERALKEAAAKPGGRHPAREEYAQFDTRKGFAVAAGAGLDVKLGSALALRLANVDYVRTWIGPAMGFDYGRQIRFTWGLVLRTGTW